MSRQEEALTKTMFQVWAKPVRMAMLSIQAGDSKVGGEAVLSRKRRLFETHSSTLKELTGYP